MTEAGPPHHHQSACARQTEVVQGTARGSEIKIAEGRWKGATQGAIGEIAIRGANVFAGYEDASNKQANHYPVDWFHTGDTGYLDAEDSVLQVAIKEMVNSGGEKITTAKKSMMCFSAIRR